MRHSIMLAVAAIAVLAFAVAGLAHEMSSIHGSVVDSKNHRPLQNVTVAVWAVHERSPVGSTLTGKDGSFLIGGLKGGDYKLVISATGYEVEDVNGLSLRPNEHLIIAGPVVLRRASLTSQNAITRECNALVNPHETADVYVVCSGR